MASSDWRQVSTILDWVILLQPKSTLDIGTGFGKYGVLCREYLDVFDGRLGRTEWARQIHGIEIFEHCISPVHSYVYDEIIKSDALFALSRMKAGSYDLALLIDVIEHFEVERGITLLRECQRVARYTLVSTPKKFFENDDSYGNPAQVHCSLWDAAMLCENGGVVISRNLGNNIALFAGTAADRAVRYWLRLKRKRELASWFPRCYSFCRSIRSLWIDKG